MTEDTQATTVGQLPTPQTEGSRLPGRLTRFVWLLWVASCGAAVLHRSTGDGWVIDGVVRMDGLTIVLWLTATFLSGIVHSYSRRYMAGDRNVEPFFRRLFAFTLVVMVLVAADNFLLFGAAWLAMGLVMARLVGHVRGWPQARAAAALVRRYFLASSAVLAGALLTLWWVTGSVTISQVASTVGPESSPLLLVAAVALVLAAMIQSALVPFQTWLLSSMTAPTPASALMHAGFVNAGGILLVRFASVVTIEPGVMLLLALLGAASALLGKLLKSVQVDVKTRLGCSTVGQMGFMILQAGLGFFGAAIAHLILHGFYKAYLFLSAGEEVAHTTPGGTTHAGTGLGPIGATLTGLTALAGGLVFAVLTGKGTSLDSGLLLTGLVVLTTMHATLSAVRTRALSAAVRYGAVPLLFLPAIALYSVVYVAVTSAMNGLSVVTEPTALTLVHAALAVAFLVAYLAIETGAYQYSDRLYVELVNVTQPPSSTSLTSRMEYNEY